MREDFGNRIRDEQAAFDQELINQHRKKLCMVYIPLAGSRTSMRLKRAVDANILSSDDEFLVYAANLINYQQPIMGAFIAPITSRLNDGEMVSPNDVASMKLHQSELEGASLLIREKAKKMYAERPNH